MTLVCKEKQQIGAHKVILAVNSESKDYFCSSLDFRGVK